MASHHPTIAPPTVLGPDDHGRAISADEFASAEFLAGWRFEREEGRLVVMSPDGPAHIRAANPWRDRLILYKLSHPGVIEEVVTDARVRVTGATDRIGDIGVYLVQDPPAFNVPDQVPDLMFEVLSPGRESGERDRVTKRAEYERLGVREYVIIDRFAGTVTVFTLGADGYRESVLVGDAIYTTPLLPGLAVPLADVLPRG
jgi:Uma2 family endonuclease